MNRWLSVALLLAACGRGEKTEKAPPPTQAIDARLADAAVASDPVAKTAPADAAGPGSAPAAAAAKVLEVVIADRVACARRTDGRVRCWGSPWDGRGLPVVASAVELPDLTTAVSIDLGADQTLYVVTDDGGVRRGTLDLRGTTELATLDGIDDVVDVRAYRTAPVVLTRTGNVFTPAAASPILTNAVALKRATNGSIQVLHRDGRVSWFDGKVHAVAKLTDATALFGDRCAEQRSGARVCWDSGRVKPWTGATNIVDRVVGTKFRCDLTGSGVACAGANDAGQLGAGPGPARTEARSVKLPGKAIAIAAGRRSACALLDSGDVACWGANDGGQLGDRTLLDRPTPTIVPGVTTPAPPPPSDGRAIAAAPPTAMDLTGLPAGCKPPGPLATLPTVASAYATTAKAGTTVWFTDFALEPDADAPALPVRGTQRAMELVLANGKKPIDRGRYTSKGPRSAKLTVHAAERAPEAVERVDLVVELVDTEWICGQLLSAGDAMQRQPFAARIHKSAR